MRDASISHMINEDLGLNFIAEVAENKQKLPLAQ
jgi:hypothetical protein